jgi:hypothetical protein
MSDSADRQGDDQERREVEAADRAALVDYAKRRLICDATGERLHPAGSVAMTVQVAPGVSTFAMVTAAHWDSGEGELSASDPRVDPDVLDGRRLFGSHLGPAGSQSERMADARPSRAPIRVQQLRPAPTPDSGPSPRAL